MFDFRWSDFLRQLLQQAEESEDEAASGGGGGSWGSPERGFLDYLARRRSEEVPPPVPAPTPEPRIPVGLRGLSSDTGASYDAGIAAAEAAAQQSGIEDLASGAAAELSRVTVPIWETISDPRVQAELREYALASAFGGLGVGATYLLRNHNLGHISDAYRGWRGWGDQVIPGLGAATGLVGAGWEVLNLTGRHVAEPLAQTAWGGMTDLGIEPLQYGIIPNVGGVIVGLGHGLLQGGLTDEQTRKRYEQAYETAPLEYKILAETAFDPLTYATGISGVLRGVGKGAVKSAAGRVLPRAIEPARLRAANIVETLDEVADAPATGILRLAGHGAGRLGMLRPGRPVFEEIASAVLGSFHDDVKAAVDAMIRAGASIHDLAGLPTRNRVVERALAHLPREQREVFKRNETLIGAAAREVTTDQQAAQHLITEARRRLTEQGLRVNVSRHDLAAATRRLSALGEQGTDTAHRLVQRYRNVGNMLSKGRDEMLKLVGNRALSLKAQELLLDKNVERADGLAKWAIGEGIDIVTEPIRKPRSNLDRGVGAGSTPVSVPTPTVAPVPGRHVLTVPRETPTAVVGPTPAPTPRATPTPTPQSPTPRDPMVERLERQLGQLDFVGDPREQRALMNARMILESELRGMPSPLPQQEFTRRLSAFSANPRKVLLEHPSVLRRLTRQDLVALASYLQKRDELLARPEYREASSYLVRKQGDPSLTPEEYLKSERSAGSRYGR